MLQLTDINKGPSFKKRKHNLWGQNIIDDMLQNRDLYEEAHNAHFSSACPHDELEMAPTALKHIYVAALCKLMMCAACGVS